MKNMMKFRAIHAMSDDAVTRIGTLGVIGGGLLALASLLF